MSVVSAVFLLLIGLVVQNRGRKKKSKPQLFLGTIITTAATVYLIATLLFISSIK